VKKSKQLKRFPSLIIVFAMIISMCTILPIAAADNYNPANYVSSNQLETNNGVAYAKLEGSGSSFTINNVNGGASGGIFAVTVTYAPEKDTTNPTSTYDVIVNGFYKTSFSGIGTGWFQFITSQFEVTLNAGMNTVQIVKTSVKIAHFSNLVFDLETNILDGPLSNLPKTEYFCSNYTSVTENNFAKLNGQGTSFTMTGINGGNGGVTLVDMNYCTEPNLPTTFTIKVNGVVQQTLNLQTSSAWFDMKTCNFKIRLNSGYGNTIEIINEIGKISHVNSLVIGDTDTQTDHGVPGVIESGVYILTTKGGDALDVVDGGTTNGTRVQLFANNNFNAQKWYVTKLDNGNYTLRSLDTSNMMLDVANGSSAAGTSIRLWSSNSDNSAQQYRLDTSGDGAYVLKTMCSNYQLCVSGDGKGGMGANIVESVYQGQNYQKFIFTPESSTQAPGWFSNALDRANSPDPFITYYNGYYYYMKTTGGDVRIRRSTKLANVSSGESKTAYTGGDNAPIKYNIWAPEMHFINGKWYIYASGTTSGTDFNSIRLFCLESDNSDPFSNYTYKGMMDISGTLAIDPSVFVDKNTGKTYITYCEFNSQGQCIMIAPMTNPTTIGYPRVQLSAPTYDWEKRGTAARPDARVNEGPIFIQKAEKTFIIYSASGCWSEYYCLGMLECDNDNLLDPGSWSKSPVPVLQEGNNVYGVGHNGFFKSPDGTQDWICFHGMDVPTGGEDNRFLYCQPFTWDTNNRPVFGTPTQRGIAIGVPSGEKQ
jgi:GH43 family beta-xylosidase